ncbi:hypothetical protein AAU57_11320 [Nonlabens sp. YIK11]|nr:hypothetical protein AAU57_11320 [Nonlabens sp. YIK11]
MIISLVEFLPFSKYQWSSFILFILVVVPAYLGSRYLALGKIKVLLSDKGLAHFWEKRFILSWQKNFKISKHRLVRCHIKEERLFDIIQIDLDDKKRYSISRIVLYGKQNDFYRLANDLHSIINTLKYQ